MSENTQSLLHSDSEAHNQRSQKRYDRESKYTDSFFAVIFIANIAIICALAFATGIRAIAYAPANHIIVNPDKSTNIDNSAKHTSSNLISGIILIFFVSGFLSIGWIYLLTNLSKRIIPFTFGVIFCVAGASLPVFIAYGNWAVAVNLFFLVIFICYLYIYLRPRMDFATATLRIACCAVRAYPYSIGFAAIMVLVQIWFGFMWILAVLGVATNEVDATIYANGIPFSAAACSTYTYYDSLTVQGFTYTCKSSSVCNVCLCGSGGLYAYSKACSTPHFNVWVYLLLTISLFWTCTVFSNIIACTTSGVIAHWWRTRTAIAADEVENDGDLYSTNIFDMIRRILSGAIQHSTAGVVRDCFFRSATYSLGSVCFGSLLVALVKTTRSILLFLIQRLKTNKRTQCISFPTNHACYPYYSTAANCSTSLQLILLKCLEYLLVVVEKSLEYFNKYAFCYVGIYGLDFKSASSSVVAMFKERGVTAVVNDEIIDIILSLGHMTIALFTLAIGYIYGYSTGLVATDRAILASTAFLTGYLVCAITLKVISASVATIYVLFAEEPQEFETTNPELYEELSDSWKFIYPSHSKSVQYGVINRDVYGGVIEPQIYVETIKIPGKYDGVALNEQQAEYEEEDVIENGSQATGSRSPNPYGRSPEPASSSSSSSWLAKLESLYSESLLLYKAALGQSLPAQNSSLKSETAIISGSWGSSDSNGRRTPDQFTSTSV